MYIVKGSTKPENREVEVVNEANGVAFKVNGVVIIRLSDNDDRVILCNDVSTAAYTESLSTSGKATWIAPSRTSRRTSASFNGAEGYINDL